MNTLEWSIHDMHVQYAAGKLTAEEVVQRCLARIEKYDGTYKAFIGLNPAVLDEARALDQRRASGEKLGVLAGVPVVIKDSINVAGLPTTAGWAALSRQAGGIDLIPDRDAPVVARLRDADALILGKGNIPAFSLSSEDANSSWAGPTYNAVDPRFIPAGSSSGVATAVSANFSVLGLAQETGGSIQNPAAAQALVGVKPTFGLVPNTGTFPLAGSTLDVLGPHARTVQDAATMLDVIAGHSIADPKTVAAIGHVQPNAPYRSQLSTQGLQAQRIGLYGSGWSNQNLSAETELLYDRAVNALINNGAITVTDPFAGSEFSHLSPANEWKQNFYGLESLAFDIDSYLRATKFQNTVHSLKDLIKATGENPFAEDGLLALIWKAIHDQPEPSGQNERSNIYAQTEPQFQQAITQLKTPPLSVQCPDLVDFTAFQSQYLEAFNHVMDEHKLDALCFPQQYQAIPTVKEPTAYPVIATPHINILGLPGVTVPGGYYKNGAPFSLIFIGRQWSEATLLRIAYAYEQSTKHRVAPTLSHQVVS